MGVTYFGQPPLIRVERLSVGSYAIHAPKSHYLSFGDVTPLEDYYSSASAASAAAASSSCPWFRHNRSQQQQRRKGDHPPRYVVHTLFQEKNETEVIILFHFKLTTEQPVDSDFLCTVYYKQGVVGIYAVTRKGQVISRGARFVHPALAPASDMLDIIAFDTQSSSSSDEIPSPPLPKYNK